MPTNSKVKNGNALSEIPATQTVYHPDFNRDVHMVAFSVSYFKIISHAILLMLMVLSCQVDGQGFKTDSARLTLHSEFLRDMLFNAENRCLGGLREGSTENPIVVHGCTKEAFANFMLWMNHK